MWTHRRSGQSHQRGQGDHRDPYERDRTRVIHCSAFRRLQGKTQILGIGEGDFHRTRLTHSLEVASIGSSIVRNLVTQKQHCAIEAIVPHDDLISVICLLHDIGHPPFGHGGESALNYMMRDHGGFEGNAQTLRLLSKVDNSYGEFGLDLTRRTLLGVLKYPVPRASVMATALPEARGSIRINDWIPPKGYYAAETEEVDWILAPFAAADRSLFQSLAVFPTLKQHGKARYHSLDCSIMDIADDIAYGVHDLEDAIHLRLITREQLDTPAFHVLLAASGLTTVPDAFATALFNRIPATRKRAIGELVNYFIAAARVDIADEAFLNPVLKYNVVLLPEAKALLEHLMACVFQCVIDSQEARTFEYGGQTVISRLFEALCSNPSNLLDIKNRALYFDAGDESSAFRVICDYIANMTDVYAYRLYERLFGFNTRTIFERL